MRARSTKKFVWIVALVTSVIAIIIVIHVARSNASKTAAIKDLIHTALFSKSDSLVHIKGAISPRSVDINKNPCSTATGVQKKALNIFTDLCDVMTGRHDGCHYDHPNVVHYVKLTDKDVEEINFQEFLSILSMHKFYKPSKIIIHSNAKKFIGKHWDLIQKLGSHERYIEIEYANRVRAIGHKQKPYYITHEVDALKVRTIIKQGGIFTDFDVIMVNGTKFRSKQKLGECVIGSDTDPCTRLCAGFVSCVANSSFARDWREGYVADYAPYLWVYNAGTLPSNLLRQCPSCYNVYVDRTISMMNEAQKWLEPNGIDWKSRSVVHYMNQMFRVSSMEITPKAVVTRFNNTALGDLFMHVLGDTHLFLLLAE